jgi:PAS domain-containing protein
MALPPPHAPDSDVPAFLDEGLRDALEAIDTPALVFLPGGRVAAVNRAMTGLPGAVSVGDTMVEMIRRFRARRADGTPVVPGDLPYARVLRGEVVGHGERFELTFSDGTVYRTLVTSTPVVREGRVVAALSVWHDFGAYVRRLADQEREARGDGR